ILFVGSAAHGGGDPDNRTGPRDLGAVLHRMIFQEGADHELRPPDTCLEDYEKRHSMFLKELIASTPNVSVRAKEFRRWIDENSPYSDAEARNRRAPHYSRYEAGASVVAAKRPGGDRDGLGPIIR